MRSTKKEFVDSLLLILHQFSILNKNVFAKKCQFQKNSNKISWFDMRSDWHFPYQPRVLICKNFIKLLQNDWTILSKVCETIFSLGFCVLCVKYVMYQKAYFLTLKYTKTQRIQINKHFPLLDWNFVCVFSWKLGTTSLDWSTFDRIPFGQADFSSILTFDRLGTIGSMGIRIQWGSEYRSNGT